MPARKHAKRTLNTSDVDPNGATYSARMYSRASVLLITIDYAQSVIELAEGNVKSLHVNSMLSNQTDDKSDYGLT